MRERDKEKDLTERGKEIKRNRTKRVKRTLLIKFITSSRKTRKTFHKS